MTPYTTTVGLQIGRCYIKPAMPVQVDAVVIQTVLLAKPSNATTLGDKVVCWLLVVAIMVVVYSVAFVSAP